MKRRLITSALPYVNNVPHLGNLIQVLSADVFARFCRLYGYETLYVCGTDEYGTATETRAAEEGIGPRELCDRYFAIHRDIYSWFAIAFDKFGRTSTPIQTEVVQELFKRLDENGLISEQTIEQLYCKKCGRFLADRYVLGVCPHCGSANARGDQCEDCGKLLDPTELKDSRCSSCGCTPSLEKTNHLYINLPQIKDRLEEWVRTASQKGFWAKNAIRMTEAWIRDGLRERAITRDLKWGIPVPKPGYEKKVFYVWFDAPIGYISITGNLGLEQGKDWKTFTDYWWKSPEETELFQFIGKDNIPFHTVIFPSTLLGSGENWTMLHHMSSSEYLNYEGKKFSKSKGIGVFGTDVMETGIPADVWRFYIFYNRPETADANFVWKDFQEKVNGELIGNLGNLVNRTLSFVTRYYGGKIPDEDGGNEAAGADIEFRNTVKKFEDEVTAALQRSDLRDAFHTIFALSSFANKAFQDGEPWRRRKGDPSDPDGPKAAASLIGKLCHVVLDIAIMIEPYMPQAAEKIAFFYGLTFGNTLIYKKDADNQSLLSWDSIGKNKRLEQIIKSEVLFARLEDDKISELSEKYSGNQKEREQSSAAEPSSVSQPSSPLEPSSALQPDDVRFANTLDLRVAKIIKVERHPKADKLYIINLELSEPSSPLEPSSPVQTETRTIVSGIVPFYKEEELLGKRIILANNLKPAKLRGVESRGMLLAAEDHNGPIDEKGEGTLRVEVLDAGDAPLGTRVVVEGREPGSVPAEIDIDTFFSIPMEAADNVIGCGGKALLVGGRQIRTAIVSKGNVH